MARLTREQLSQLRNDVYGNRDYVVPKSLIDLLDTIAELELDLLNAERSKPTPSSAGAQAMGDEVKHG